MRKALWRARHSVAVIALIAIHGRAAFVSEQQIPAPARGQYVVDDATLSKASAEEWLTYGRDYAETHFSPLNQINTSNVNELGLQWSWDIGSEGQLEAPPLVSNGVMYATSTWSKVFALDARTGTVIWRWDPGVPTDGSDSPRFCCGPVNRGVAIYRDKVYVGLLDGRLVALDAQSGRVVWSVVTTPRGSNYSITGAPRVLKNKVIIGNAGAEFGVRGFISAYDATTGEQRWRFYTVPGNPADGFENDAMRRAAQTWSGEWWKIGGGGTAWDGMAYDPEADLLYVGTGNGSPWSRDIRSAGTGDNLFLSSILALRPDTGQLVWHYQTTPGDDWDYTSTQPLMLLDLTIEGRQRNVIVQAPKNGFFYVVDRLTGQFISALPLTHVTWAMGVHPITGRPIEAPTARYGSTGGAWLSPSAGGARTWEAMSWNPMTRLVYVPGHDTVSYYAKSRDFRYNPRRYNTGLDARRNTPRPAAPQLETQLGFVVAWDPVAQRERWRVRMTGWNTGGTLSTAGTLVFAGSADGRLLALNAETGAQLWETRTGRGVAQPVTYELDGRQYVTVLAGHGWDDPARVWTYTLNGKAPMPAESATRRQD